MDFFEATIKPAGKGKSSTATSTFVGAPLVDPSSLNGILNETKIKELIIKADKAYVVEPLIKMAVDMYTTLCTDFKFKGDDQIAMELLIRLETICFQSGTTWYNLYSSIIHDYFKRGNAYILKGRGKLKVKGASTGKAGTRTLFKQNSNPIKTLTFVPPSTLTTFRLRDDKKFYGWKVQEKIYLTAAREGKGSGANFKFELELPAGIPDDILFPNIDVAHLAHNKDSQTQMGTSLVFGVIDIVNNLRQIENTVEIAIRKTAIPIPFYTIDKTGPINKPENIMAQIEDAKSNISSLNPQGFIFAPANHKLEFVGAESTAMKTSPYLEHWMKRVISGLGVPNHRLGMDNTSALAADHSSQAFVDLVKCFRREINDFFQSQLFFELLWELGYDPYLNPDERIELEFIEPDPNLLIKLQSHYADLFTKGVIDIDEARLANGYEDPVNLGRTYQLLYAQDPTAANNGVVSPKKVKNSLDSPIRVKNTAESIKIYINGSKVTANHICDELGIPYTYLPEIRALLLADKVALIEYLVDLLGLTE